MRKRLRQLYRVVLVVVLRAVDAHRRARPASKCAGYRLSRVAVQIDAIRLAEAGANHRIYAVNRPTDCLGECHERSLLRLGERPAQMLVRRRAIAERRGDFGCRQVLPIPLRKRRQMPVAEAAAQRIDASMPRQFVVILEENDERSAGAAGRRDAVSQALREARIKRTDRVGNMSFAVHDMLAGDVPSLPERRFKPPTDLNVRSREIPAYLCNPFAQTAVRILRRTVELRVHRMRTGQNEPPQTPTFPRHPQVCSQRLRIGHVRVDRHHRVERLRHCVHGKCRAQQEGPKFHAKVSSG